MSNLKSLIKYNLLNSFPIINKLINNKLNKKKNKSIIFITTIFIILFLIIFALLTLYLVLFESIFAQAGHPEVVLLMAITISAVMVFFTNLSLANSYIFRTKDYDLLMSIPIKESDIVISKLISLYIYNFVFVFSIMTGAYIAYIVYNDFDIVFTLLYFISLLFAPLIPIGISSIIAFLLGYIPLSQKIKNIFSTILYAGLFIIFSIAYTSIMKSSETELMNQIGFLSTIFKKVYFMTGTIFEGFYNKDIISFIIFITSSLIVMIIFIIIVSKTFKHFNNYTNRKKINKTYKLNSEKYSTNSEVKSLFIKEFRQYINIPSYIMNTIVGPILSLVCTITLSTQLLEGAGSLLGSIVNPENIDEYAMGLLGVVLILLMSLTSTSSSSISLEGKRFWIIKSLPVKTSSVFISKILLNVIIFVPFIIIDVIIASIIIKCSVFMSILVLVMNIFMALAFSIYGLYINILLPKFNYESPIKVVKQSSAVLVVMITSFIIDFISIFLYNILNVIFNPMIGIVCTTIFSLIIFILSLILLLVHGKKKYELLNA